MTTNRREFLKIAGVSALTLMAPSILLPGLGQRQRDHSRQRSRRTPSTFQGPDGQTLGHGGGCRQNAAPAARIASPPAMRRTTFPISATPRMRSNGSGLSRLPPSSPVKITPYLGKSFRQLRLPVFCNHCENPPCVRVCPTKATFQRADGIVMMDYHRCIGCRLCMAACPYGARSMNYRDPRPFIAKINPDFPTRTKGVVEKCNFCEERLAKGMLPACVAGL